METSRRVDESATDRARLAWLTLLLAAWIITGLFLISYAFDNELTRDVLVSPYHIPLYTAVVVLTAACAVLVIRAVRAGRSWREALPPGYGIVLAGVVMLIAWPIVEIGWREGIGVSDDFPERFLAPNRLLVIAGAGLIAGAPLRAALVVRSRPLAWPAAISAALILVLVNALQILPSSNVWLERAPNELGDEGEIWVMNGDGSMQTRVIAATDGYDYGNPTWSPDGTQIAYTRAKPPERNGVRAQDVAIWIASADGSNRRLLVEGAGWYWLPHWSPDGQDILFTLDPPNGVGTGAGVAPPDIGFGLPPGAGQPNAVAPNVDIWRVRADRSGPPERVTEDPAEDRAGVYSADGQHIAFDSTRDEGRTAVYVMNADGSAVTRQTFFGDDWGAAWAPDGTRIVFHSNPAGGASDLYVIEFPASAEPTQLTNTNEPEWLPAFSADGTRIAFNRIVDGQMDIWGMNADGSNQVNLTQSPNVEDSLTPGGGGWAPDGRILYQRTQSVTAGETAFVRDTLGTISTILSALVVAFLVFVAVVARAPFGAVAVIMALATAVVAIGTGDWRFLPAALAAGLLVDVLIRLADDRQKPVVGAAAAATLLVVAAGITVAVTTGLGWTPTLLIGVALASGILAWGMAGLIRGTWRDGVVAPEPGATM